MERSIKLALASEPGMKVAFVAFPGTPFATPHHYGVFMRGDEAFASRLYRPVLIDAQTGEMTDRRTLRHCSAMAPKMRGGRSRWAFPSLLAHGTGCGAELKPCQSITAYKYGHTNTEWDL